MADKVAGWKKANAEEAGTDAATLLANAEPILDAVDQNIQIALALAEINRPARFDGSLIAKFNDTLAGNVFGLVRKELGLSLVAALARIWDTEKDSQSIPTAARYLTRKDVVDLIVQKRREAMLSITTHPPFAAQAKADPVFGHLLRHSTDADAAKAERETRERACRLVAKVDEFFESSLKDSLYEARTRVIAHSLAQTRGAKKAISKGEPIEPLKIDDEEKIIKITKCVWPELNILLRSLSVQDLDRFGNVWSEFSVDFWSRFSAEPKGRPQTSDAK